LPGKEGLAMNKERKEGLPVTYADIEHAAELLEGQIPVTP